MARLKFYDGKKLFQVYCAWGSAANVNKLNEWAKENMPNPETGKVSQVGPYYAMWAWAFKNPKEAYPVWKEYMFRRFPGKELQTFDDFIEFLNRRVGNNNNIAGKQERERFRLRYGLPTKVNLKPDDVVQVVKPNHFLFQHYMTVRSVAPEEGFIEACILHPDGTTTNHQLKIAEVGRIGTAIVS